MVTESILNSIKKMLGIERDFTNFDPELIMHINSVFVTLCDLGVGPEKPYAIEDSNNVWSEFTTGTSYQNIKTYIYLRVRLLFDPPANSFAVTSFSEQIKELEWRLNVQAESKPNKCRPKEKITLTIERDLCGGKHSHYEPPKPPHHHKPSRPKPDDPDDGSENPENPDDIPSTSTDIFIKPEDGKLPDAGEPDKIYLIPNGGDDPNIYDEYFWDVDRNKFEPVGPDHPTFEEMSRNELVDAFNRIMEEKGLL